MQLLRGWNIRGIVNLMLELPQWVLCGCARCIGMHELRGRDVRGIYGGNVMQRKLPSRVIFSRRKREHLILL